MTDKEIKESVVECTASLANAIVSAGGHFHENVVNMTVKELIANVMGPNSMRFGYVLRREDE